MHMTATADMIRREIAETNPGLCPVSRKAPAPVFGIRPHRKVSGRYHAYDVFDAQGRLVRRSADLFDAMMWIQRFASETDEDSVIDSPAMGADLIALDACD